MNNQLVSQAAFITSMEARLNCEYTEEQRALIEEFDRPTICFASPGTGKTHTAIAGLINAELYKGIPGENIYALSFTRMATAELSVRHKAACEKLRIQPTVTFKTLHSLCAEILRKNYRYFDLERLDTEKQRPLKDQVKLVEEMVTEWGEKITPQVARAVVLACQSLNSALIFDDDTVKTKMAYKETHCEYELFKKIRRNLFVFPMYTGKIPVDCLMLYALVLMLDHPEVSEQFKSKCKLMLVDEAQDLSLLHLRIISLLTDNPILIGDMKQQIYAFNGACQEIVDQFYRLFPQAETKELTQSFRCKNEIINFANEIIVPNNLDGKVATGTGNGGSVQVLTDLSLEELAHAWAEDFKKNNNMFSRDTLILFRNNASATPIAEALFRCQVPFRVNNYIAATELPVVKEMVEILTLCRNPYGLNYVHALGYLIPELRGYGKVQDNPIYKICDKNNCNVFGVNYVFKDPGVGAEAMALLMELSEEITKGTVVFDLMNMLWPMYEEQWLHNRTWMLEYSPAYYLNLVQPVIRDKTFDKFVSDEGAKLAFIKENLERHRGIRCYTMHASKGLEADDVYILDADADLIPNLSKLDKMCKKHCEMDAAREIRNERSLCYVACTRAREHVYIVPRVRVAPMLMGENEFQDFDNLYTSFSIVSDDINAFNAFAREKV